MVFYAPCCKTLYLERYHVAHVVPARMSQLIRHGYIIVTPGDAAGKVLPTICCTISNFD